MIRILHVDDEIAEHELAKFNLQRISDQIEITWKESADSALSALRADSYDCIISDYQMPGKNGLEFLMEVRKRNIDLPFVFLTGQGHEQLAAESFRSGADDYFTKERGFAHYDRLLNTIRKCIRERKLAQDHKDAVKALRKSEEQYRSLFENMLNGFAYHEIIQNENEEPVDYRYLDINRKFTEMVGLDKSIIGKTVREVIPGIERDPADWIGVYGKVALTGEPAAFENYSDALDKWFRVTASCPERGYFVTVFEDITDIVQSRLKLEESSARYALLVENVTDVVWIMDLDTRQLTYNSPSVANFSGYYPEELEGIHISEIMTPSALKTAEEIIESEYLRAMKEGSNYLQKTFTLELELFHKDGHTILSEITAKFIINQKTFLPESIIGVTRDISKRSQKKTAFRTTDKNIIHAVKEADQSNNDINKYRTLFENAGDYILLFELADNGRPIIIDANESACRIHGYTKEEMVGQPVSFIDKDETPELIEQRSQSVETGNPVIFETIHTRKDGSRFPIEASVRKIMVGGKPIILSIERDITERKSVESELETSREKLAATNKELEAFSYSVSHDLKAPLRQLAGFSEVIHHRYSEQLDVQGRKLLEAIREASDNMKSLIDNLLDFSRVQQFDLKRMLVDLSVLSKSVEKKLRNADPERDARIEIEEHLQVEGDESLLQIVMENLLNNAWKFSEKKNSTVIKIASKTVKGERIFYVKDNGAGFDPSRSEDLFAPFRRLHPQSDFSGTGIGLATVQRIIHRHDGKIWAEGEPGKGATFYFTIGK